MTFGRYRNCACEGEIHTILMDGKIPYPRALCGVKMHMYVEGGGKSCSMCDAMRALYEEGRLGNVADPGTGKNE